MVTRRGFIGGFGAAFAGARFGALAGDAGGTPIMKFGVLSDVHLNANGDETHFVKALEWFRDQGADAVMIAGDIADTGRIDQLECCANCWFRVFPNNKAPDGRTVERLFVYGNHDIEGWTYVAASNYPNDASKRAQVIGFENNRAAVWQRLFDEEFAPVWMKNVKGFTFIGAHWENHCPRIESFMQAHASEIDPSRPFFYTQHSHPQDTCYGPWAWGHDPGYATRALAPFANAVAFSGHSHYTLTDERSVWQGAFTSIGTATLRRTSLDYACVENSNGNDFDAAEKSFGRARAMKPLYREDGKQGMLVDVYTDRLVIHRRDFVYDGSLGADWTIPIPSATAAPVYSFAARAAVRSAPAFAAGAKPSVFLQTTPPSCASAAVTGPCAYVTFPAARTVDGCRVFSYQVTARGADNAVVDARRVMAPGFNLPASEADRSAECVFPLSLFAPGASVRFEVRAEECFGKQGAPIVSDPVQISANRAASNGVRVDANPEATFHWRTMDGRCELNWVWPRDARSAKLTIEGLKGREVHVFGSATDSWPFEPSGMDEDVYSFRLDFFPTDGATGDPIPGATLRAKGVGRVRTQSARVLPQGAADRAWTHAPMPRAVLPIPLGATGLTRDGIAVETGAPPCWHGWSNIADGSQAAWSLAGAQPCDVLLRGISDGFRLFMR